MPPDARQLEVEEQQVDGAALAEVDEEVLAAREVAVAVGGVDEHVGDVDVVLLDDAAHALAERLLVVDHDDLQDDLLRVHEGLLATGLRLHAHATVDSWSPRAAPASSSWRGSEIVKVVNVGPLAGSALDSTAILPRCILTMPWVTARPRPVPLPTCLVVKNGLKSFSRCSGAMPVPVSAIVEHHVLVGAVERDRDAPAVGHRVLGVGEQVAEHLDDLVGVDLGDGVGELVVDDDLHVLLAREGAQHVP